MADRRRQGLGGYRQAQLAAREMEGRLRLRVARQVQSDLAKYAENLRRGLINLPGGERSIEAAASLTQRLSLELEAAIQRAVTSHQLIAYEEVAQIWERAGVKAAESLGFDAKAMFGGVLPNLPGVAAFESIGGARHWKTLVHGYVQGATQAANGVIREGLIRNVSPQRLARGLRSYVTGSEPFHKAFGGIEGMTLTDLRKVDPRAAGALRYNSYRIAVSETHNARWLAESSSFMADPFIQSVAWRLSPQHQAEGEGDECDLLAFENYYGLGAGVYPVDRVPDPPHPFDQCEQVPITQDEPAPKPLGLPLAKDPMTSRVYGKGLTAAQAIAIRERAARALQSTISRQSADFDVVSRAPTRKTLKEMADVMALLKSNPKMSPADIGIALGFDAKKVRRLIRMAKDPPDVPTPPAVPRPPIVPTPKPVVVHAEIPIVDAIANARRLADGEYIPIGDVLRMDIGEGLPMVLPARAQAAIVETIDLSKVVVAGDAQASVELQGVIDYIRRGPVGKAGLDDQGFPTDFPVVYKKGDKYIILEGHHRLAAAKLRNFSQVQVRVVVEIPKVSPPGTIVPSIVPLKLGKDLPTILRLQSEGLTPTDIATKLGMTPAAVRRQLRKAKGTSKPAVGKGVVSPKTTPTPRAAPTKPEDVSWETSLPPRHRKKVRGLAVEAFKGASPEILSVVDRLPKIESIVTDKSGAWYMPGRKRMALRSITRGGRNPSSLRHEYGHHVDRMLWEESRPDWRAGTHWKAGTYWSEGEFGDEIEKIRNRLLRDDDYYERIKAAQTKGWLELYKAKEMGLESDWNDLFGSITYDFQGAPGTRGYAAKLQSKKVIGRGHEYTYYTANKHRVPAETFANMFEMYVVGERFPVIREVLEEAFPELTAIFRKKLGIREVVVGVAQKTDADEVFDLIVGKGLIPDFHLPAARSYIERVLKSGKVPGPFDVAVELVFLDDDAISEIVAVFKRKIIDPKAVKSVLDEAKVIPYGEFATTIEETIEKVLKGELRVTQINQQLGRILTPVEVVNLERVLHARLGIVMPPPVPVVVPKPPKPPKPKKPKTAAQILRKTFKDVNATPAQKEALKEYVFDGNLQLNDLLRNYDGNFGKWEAALKASFKDHDWIDQYVIPRARTLLEGLDNTMASMPVLQEEVTVYRSVRNVFDFVGVPQGERKAEALEDAWRKVRAMKGSVIQDQGFVSTTPDAKKALNWGQLGVGGRHNRGFMIEMRLPPGTKGSYINSVHPDPLKQARVKSEYLLNRGAKFRVVDVVDEDGLITLIVEHIP